MRLARPRTGPSFETRMGVAFCDLDPLGIVWHGNYLKYFDCAREGLLRSLGVDLYGFFMETGFAFPIIRSEIKHISPLRYADSFLCRATLVEFRRKLVMDFAITRESDGVLCAKGTGEQAAVKMPEMELALVIPEKLQNLLSRAAGWSPPTAHSSSAAGS